MGQEIKPKANQEWPGQCPSSLRPAWWLPRLGPTLAGWWGAFCVLRLLGAEPRPLGSGRSHVVPDGPRVSHRCEAGSKEAHGLRPWDRAERRPRLSQWPTCGRGPGMGHAFSSSTRVPKHPPRSTTGTPSACLKGGSCLLSSQVSAPRKPLSICVCWWGGGRGGCWGEHSWLCRLSSWLARPPGAPGC